MSFAAPIGISDFRALRSRGATYVDKTASIAKALHSAVQVMLFPRPRRFGKSLWLSTLQAYVERTPSESHGSERDEDADSRRVLFEGLAILDDAAARAHLARYPVISLSFKDVKYNHWNGCRRSMMGVIARAFRAHRTLRPSMDTYDSAIFDAIVAREDDEVLHSEALGFLSELLHRHYGERAVLLIDEYDMPIHAGYSHGYYDRVVGFMRNLLSGGLKDNGHVFKGMLTGVLRVAKESIFSGLNNVDVYTVLRSEYGDSFGFTPAEVEALAAAAGASEHMPTLRAWYDGYRFGGQTIYNPWSVLKFLDSDDKEPRAHWALTGSDEIVRGLLARGSLGAMSAQEALFRGVSAKQITDDQVASVANQEEDIEQTIVEPLTLREVNEREGSAWSLLLFSGYLTATAVSYGEQGVRARLRIPNREVRSVFATMLRDFWRKGLGTEGAVDALLEALLSGKGDLVQMGLESLFLTHLSYHDLPKPARELPYHMFVLGLLVRLAADYEVRSNPETGRGRADVLITPRTPGKPGVVMELKRVDAGGATAGTGKLGDDPGDEIDKALEGALSQIDERAYAAALQARGAQPVHAYAAIFDGKRVYVRVRTA